MSGDHNMHQMHMKHEGRAKKNAAHLEEMHRNRVKSVDEQERYKSQIERQCVEMQAALDLLKATVETLYMRLKPVMADAPRRTANTEMPPVVSPLGLSINQYRQQTTAVIDELAYIIESLEV